jgi:SOS-response transcriptional repressor LexA
MLKAVVNRVEQRLEALNLTASAASARAGLSRDAIRNMQRAAKTGTRQGVSTNTLAALAAVLKTTPQWLLDGSGEEDLGHGTVPLVGKVGAGAAARYYGSAQGEIDRVPAPKNPTKDTVAVEIEGQSLGPYYDGWLVYYDEVHSPVTPDLISRDISKGPLCVVGLADDRVLIKKITKSKTPGLHHLLSSNDDPILDVEITWAAKVRSIEPR